MLDSKTLADNLTRVIIDPLIALLFAAGLLLFVWGIVEFLIGNAQSGDSEKRENGKRHMLWGIIGMFIMASSYALLAFIAANACGSLSACTQSF